MPDTNVTGAAGHAVIAVNDMCPWSGKSVSSDSITSYKGHPVGFCNTGCRDKFDRAIGVFDAAIAGLPAPRTLLGFVGAVRAPARLSEAALVVIDAQAEYRDGSLRLEGIDGALERVATLIARARAAGTPVVHVRQKGRADGLFDPARGGVIMEDAAPLANEPVVEKTLPNAFAGTRLHEKLAGLERPKLILAGFMTHMCISASARAGLDLGHEITVAGDAAATRALPGTMGGAPVSARQVHETALAELADRFAVVVAVDSIFD